jgi:hypothetical protein
MEAQMKLVRTVVSALILSAVFAIPAHAAPLNLTLAQATTFSSGPMTVVGGSVNLSGQKIGDFSKVTHTVGGNPRFGALTLTIFFPDAAGALGATITLQGGQDVTAFFAKGTISASSLPNLVGVPFSLNLVTNVLTLQFP